MVRLTGVLLGKPGKRRRLPEREASILMEREFKQLVSRELGTRQCPTMLLETLAHT